MRPAFLLVLAALATGSGAADKPVAGASAPGDTVMTPLARKYALKRQALYRESSERIRALVESPAWSTMSRTG